MRTTSGEEGGVSVSGIVLAAGRATRMGGHKLLLPIGGLPMLHRVVEASLNSRAAQTVLVVGHDAEAILEAMEGWPVTVVVNPDFAAGMSTSVRAGLLAVDPACDAALFLLGDQPFVTAGLLNTLIEHFAQSGKSVIRPSVGTHPANPVLIAAELFPEVLQERGDVGARRVLERHASEVLLVPVDDPHVCVDIDSPEEYEEEKDA